MRTVLSRRERRRLAKQQAREEGRGKWTAAWRKDHKAPALMQPLEITTPTDTDLEQYRKAKLEQAEEMVAEPEVHPRIQQAHTDAISSLTLKELRAMAQQQNVRVDGKRPSLCSKAELVTALS